MVQRGVVRLVVADCSVEYSGRLGARLPRARRLLLFKADGSLAVHGDSKAYKPLNWMNPPCSITEREGMIRVSNPKGEALVIELHDVLLDQSMELGDDPGLAKDGVETELQELIAARVQALRDDLRLVRREFPTDLGPVDLLCRDGDGRAVVVEVEARSGRSPGSSSSCATRRGSTSTARSRRPGASSSRRGSSPRPACSPRAGAWSASRSTSTTSAPACPAL